MTLKSNIIEQVTNIHNKNQKKKFVAKKKGTTKKFNGKWFTYNKTGH